MSYLSFKRGSALLIGTGLVAKPEVYDVVVDFVLFIRVLHHIRVAAAELAVPVYMVCIVFREDCIVSTVTAACIEY